MDKRELNRQAARWAKNIAESKGRLENVIMNKITLLESSYEVKVMGEAKGKKIETAFFSYVMFEYEGKQYQVYATDKGYTFNEYVPTPEFPELTEMETQTLFDITQDQFYEDGVESGVWADCFVEYCTISSEKVRGVLSSLIKKGMINPITKGKDGAIFFTELGKKYIIATYLTQNPATTQRPVSLETVKPKAMTYVVVNERTGKPVTDTKFQIREFDTEAEALKLADKMIDSHPTTSYTVKPLTETAAEAPKTYTDEAIPPKAESDVTKEEEKPAELKSKPQLDRKSRKTSDSPSHKAKKAQLAELKAGKGEVLLKAFTGMVIGVFKIDKKTKKEIVITTNKGKLRFDVKTLKQSNAKNLNFANRIELGE